MRISDFPKNHKVSPENLPEMKNVSKSTIHPWNHTSTFIYEKERFNLFKVTPALFETHDGGVPFYSIVKKVNIQKMNKLAPYTNEAVVVTCWKKTIKSK